MTNLRKYANKFLIHSTQMAKSFCFVVAMLQIVMFIVSLCIPPFGFAPPSENPMLGNSTFA